MARDRNDRDTSRNLGVLRRLVVHFGLTDIWCGTGRGWTIYICLVLKIEGSFNAIMRLSVRTYVHDCGVNLWCVLFLRPVRYGYALTLKQGSSWFRYGSDWDLDPEYLDPLLYKGSMNLNP